VTNQASFVQPWPQICVMMPALKQAPELPHLFGRTPRTLGIGTHTGRPHTCRREPSSARRLRYPSAATGATVINVMPSYGDRTGAGASARPGFAPWSLVSGTWERHHDLLRNAGSLVATTGVTSVMGLAFWTFAAREFSQQSVGYGSAAVSVMTLLGTLGMFGFGTMLIGELPRRRARGSLVAAALLASGLGSLVLGLTFALVISHFSSRFAQISASPSRVGLFAFGVALTGASLVFDEATIGLMRGGLQLSRNLAFSIAKMAVLPVTAAILHDRFGVGIILAWVLGGVASLVPLAVLIRRQGSRVLHRPDWAGLRGLGKTTLAHNWLNLAIGVPSTLIPVLVTVTVSPSAGAAFYVAWMIVSFLFIVPTHLSTVLFAVASADPAIIAKKLRFVLRLSLFIGLPVVFALGLGAHLALSVFGANYASLATVPLLILIAGYLPALPKTQYIAVCRAKGQVTKAAIVLTTFAACEMGAVVVGGKLGGLRGLCLAILAVGIIEGLVTAPAVVRTAIGHGRHRRAGSADPAEGAADGMTAAMIADAALGTPLSLTGLPVSGAGRAEHRTSAQQEAGLAALIALATPVTPGRPGRRSPGGGPRESGLYSGIGLG
jgi:O-antigen/teichoic acid export membrane protein